MGPSGIGSDSKGLSKEIHGKFFPAPGHCAAVKLPQIVISPQGWTLVFATEQTYDYFVTYTKKTSELAVDKPVRGFPPDEQGPLAIVKESA